MLERLRRFMAGRHGVDQLNIALLVCGLFFSLCARLFTRWFYIPADALYFWMIFRALSRHYEARYRENALFLRYWEPVKAWFGSLRLRFSDRQAYKYFKCPNCGQQLRAPRGRGTIEVTCQRCGNVFRRKV